MVIKTLASWTKSLYWNKIPFFGHFIKKRDQNFLKQLKTDEYYFFFCNSVVERTKNKLIIHLL